MFISDSMGLKTKLKIQPNLKLIYLVYISFLAK